MISIEQLKFRYPDSDFQLAIESLEIRAGEKIAIVGPSGSGKTTLLNLLAGISTAQAGQIKIGDTELTRLNDAQRRNFRISQIGMVFQQFELIEYLTARDNILLPFAINSTLMLTSELRERSLRHARDMGLGDKLQRRPQQLSQGEQQRVAVCRALANQPALILADEPTGNLDPANKLLILKLLFDAVAAHGQTLIVVTHDMGILDGFDRTIDFNQFRSLAEASNQ